MTIALTERDKKLLRFLAVFLIVIGFGVFVILPALDKTSELDARIMDLENEKFDMEMAIQSLGATRQTNEKLWADFTEKTEGFYPMLLSQGIGKELTNTMLSCGVDIVRMNLTMPEEPLTITPYTMSAMAAKYKQQEEQAESEAGADGEATEDSQADTAASRFYAAPVQISIIGSKENIEKLLDIFNESGQSLRVTSYEITEQRENASATGKYTADIKLDVYMYKE